MPSISKIGAGLGCFWLIQTGAYFYSGMVGNIFWLCNFMLALGAAGVLINSTFLASAALSGSFGIHILWTLDFISFLLTGHFLFQGIASYAAELSAGQFVLTSHHLFLWPCLFCWLRRKGKFDSRGWMLAAVTFCVLLLVSRLFGFQNINCSFFPCVLRSGDALILIHRLGYWGYLAFVGGLASFGIFLPTSFLFSVLFGQECIERTDGYYKPLPAECCELLGAEELPN